MKLKRSEFSSFFCFILICSSFITISVFAASTPASPCDKKLTPTPVDLESVLKVEGKVEFFSQILPEVYATEEIFKIRRPLLRSLAVKLEEGIEPTEEELSNFQIVLDKLNAPLPSPKVESPNRGLNPAKARELMRFYDPWERQFSDFN